MATAAVQTSGRYCLPRAGSRFIPVAIPQRPEILEAIFNQLPEAQFLYDKSLRIIGVNQSAQRLFSMSSKEMIGQQCQQLFRCADSRPSMLSTGTITLHTITGPGRMVVVRTAQILDAAGALEGVIATVKNVAEEALPVKRQIVAESQAMLDLLELVRRIAVSEANSILIEGENGTGKDLIAKALHYQSVRQCKPFVTINCAAIPGALLESELFGHEKGAFTDARAQKVGLFELADKGTLFLDEIAELPLPLQVKLLRVLEYQSFRRVGGLRDITIDVRIIAATNKDLRNAVKDRALRQDLYYRLNVIQLTIPPLRERSRDVLPLARFFVEHYNRKFKLQIDSLSPATENLLLAHSWPGNVRELRNAIERAMILEDTDHIRPSSLPTTVCPGDSCSAETTGSHAPWLPDHPMSLAEHEHHVVVQALKKTGGNRSQSALLLGITRDKLRYKMKKFNLYC